MRLVTKHRTVRSGWGGAWSSQRAGRAGTLAALALSPIGIWGHFEWVWIAVGLLALPGAVLGARRLRAAPALVALAALIGYTGVSLTWSADAGEGLGMLVQLLVPAAVLLAAFEGSANPSTLRVARHIAVGWTLALTVTLVAVRDDQFDVIATDAPLRHASMALVALVLVLAATGRTRFLIWGIGAVCVVAVAMAGSRTALVVLVLVLVTNRSSWITAAGRAVVFGGLVAAGAMWLSQPSVQRRWFGYGTLANPLHELAALNIWDSGRRKVWSAIYADCSSILVGDGLGSANAAAQDAFAWPDPHNDFLRMACDVGIIGSALLWGLLAGTAVAVWRSWARRPNPVGYAAMQGLAALGLFAIVWNPVTAVEFTAPLAVVVGWALRLGALPEQARAGRA